MLEKRNNFQMKISNRLGAILQLCLTPRQTTNLLVLDPEKHDFNV